MASAPLASIPRDYPRIMSQIPVQIQVAHAWETSMRASMAATLFNVSRGGAGVFLPYVLPPRTRLAVLIPVARCPACEFRQKWFGPRARPGVVAVLRSTGCDG